MFKNIYFYQKLNIQQLYCKSHMGDMEGRSQHSPQATEALLPAGSITFPWEL